MDQQCSGARRWVRAAAAAALALGLGACGGDNLFKNNPPVTEGPPIVKQLLVPATAFEGDAIPVQVEAVARRGLTEIQLRYRGALNTDQNIGFELGTDSVVTTTTVTVLERLDSVLVVTATALDRAGRLSSPRVDTVIVREVTSTAPGQ